MSHAHVWEFNVPPEPQSEFEHHYGPDGTWAQLFSNSAGHIETILLKDKFAADRYVTVDRWRDEDAFRVFRSSFSQQYERLDREFHSVRVALCYRALGVAVEDGISWYWIGTLAEYDKIVGYASNQMHVVRSSFGGLGACRSTRHRRAPCNPWRYWLRYSS